MADENRRTTVALNERASDVSVRWTPEGVEAQEYRDRGQYPPPPAWVYGPTELVAEFHDYAPRIAATVVAPDDYCIAVLRECITRTMRRRHGENAAVFVDVDFEATPLGPEFRKAGLRVGQIGGRCFDAWGSAYGVGDVGALLALARHVGAAK